MSRRPKERNRFTDLAQRLSNHQRTRQTLPGLVTPEAQTCFLEQMIDSLHRIEYFDRILERPIDGRRADPSSNLFCPLRAAIIFSRQGEYDEACWLIFLAMHFNPHPVHGWEPLKTLYCGRTDRPFWTWVYTSNHLDAFEDWLHEHHDSVKQGFPSGLFGNHRKYETLDPNSRAGPHRVVRSYVNLVGPNRGHRNFFEHEGGGEDATPEERFANLYRQLTAVHRFGRTAKFDYLCMLSKLCLADIRPDRPYIPESTGPLRGARLAFTGTFNGNLRPKTLENMSISLANTLGVGMQPIEDCLCNWQKSPNSYIAFRS